MFAHVTILAAAPGEPGTRHLHVGFGAPSRSMVDAFWRAGAEAGYEDAGRPGERDYTEDYYGAFLLDPDAAEAFYLTIARHTGLREGSSEYGRHFRGAWATFSLIHDGRPPTERLHMAFPAPDRQAVDEFHAAALAAGYTDNGRPGERPQYGRGYYAAYVLDPDGTNVESVVRAPGVGVAGEAVD